MNIKQRLSTFWHTQWQEVVHAIGITLLAIVLARFIGYDLMSLLSFTPKNKAADFQFSDVYQSVAERKAVHQLSKDITIVSIDGYGRTEVLDAINIISECEPTAIGIDVFFQNPETDNTMLLTTLSSVPNIVCAAKFEKDDGKTTYHHVRQSFFEEDIAVRWGYVNLNASSMRDVIREFMPFVLTSTGDTLLSMPAQLAKLTNPIQYETLIARGGKLEPIAFENIEFSIVPIQDILSGEADISLLKNKVVLMGDTNNITDLHMTPLHQPMAGVKFHAYALHTILSGNYIESSPEWFNWLFAIVLGLLFTICNLLSKYRRGYWVRIVQFITMYILLVLGCKYFTIYHTYIDFSLAILLIGFGAVAFDIWFGVYVLYNFVKNKILKI